MLAVGERSNRQKVVGVLEKTTRQNSLVATWLRGLDLSVVGLYVSQSSHITCGGRRSSNMQKICPQLLFLNLFACS